MQDKTAKKIIARFEEFKSKRTNYENTWQDISEYILPSQSTFNVKYAPGQRRNRKNVIDRTATKANEFLSSRLHEGLTNSAMKWLKIGAVSSEPLGYDENVYLESVTNITLDALNNIDSGFQAQVHEFYQSLVAFGTAAMFIDTDHKGLISFATLHLSEIYICEDAFGAVDTIFRKFKLTARQALQKWDEKDLHPKLLECAEKEPDKELEFIHAVMPRDDSANTIPNKFKIASYYIDILNQHTISEGGFYENPYVITRFSKLSNEYYGNSPAWNALSEIKTINVMLRSAVKSGELQATPPLLASSDGVMFPLNVKPNGIIMGGIDPVSGRPNVSPLNVGGNPGVLFEYVKLFRTSIREHFYIDELMFREGTPASATEFMQRQQERFRAILPQISRIQREFLDPVVKRVTGLLFRQGVLGEIPEGLRNKDFAFEYESPLIKLQKAGDLQAISQFLNSVVPLAQIFPDILDSINMDNIVQKAATSTGVDTDVLRSPEETAEIRQARQEQQAIQMALQGAKEGSETLKNLNLTGE